MNGGAATVSVCVPALNAEPFIAATVESVLAQTHQDWQLVVVDNASADRTAEIVRSYGDPRIKLVTNERTVSMVENWNRAVAAADAPLVKLLCADDLIDPSCLARQLAAIDQAPGAALVAGLRDVIDDDGTVVLCDRGLAGIVGVHDGPDVLRRLVASGTNTIGWPAAVLFRRDHFEQVGGFREEWSLLMDLDLWTRLLPMGSFVGLEHSVASFRVWSQATSASATTLGPRHRALLRLVATDEVNGIGPWTLRRGLALTSLESLKRRLLYAAVGSRSAVLRRLPSLLVQPRRAIESLTP
ncbi:MAG: glycosyltransferase [Actinomycetota bacterium]